MSNEPSTKTQPAVSLDADTYRLLTLEAARRTIATGRRVSARAVVREAVAAYLGSKKGARP